MIIDRIHSLIRADRQNRSRYLEQKIMRTIGDHASRGLARSGMVIYFLKNVILDELKARANNILGTLIRVYSQLGTGFNDSLGLDLKKEANILFDEDKKELIEKIKHKLSWASQNQLSIEVESIGPKNFLDAEIDLYVETLKRKQREPANVAQNVINIHAPVGALQTGPGATAHIIQSITSEEKELLLDGLKRLKEDLSKIIDIENETKGEILALAEESENELKKENPRIPILRSMLNSIATTIQTIGSLQPAYQTIKSALAPLGIYLP